MGKTCPVKTLALPVKWDKLVTAKPGKNKQLKVAIVELRGSRGLHKPEKSGRSAGDIKKKFGNEKTPKMIKQQEPASQKPSGGLSRVPSQELGYVEGY